MAERLRNSMLARKNIESPDNGKLKQCLESLLEMVNSGDLSPEQALRHVWEKSSIEGQGRGNIVRQGEFTIEERKSLLNSLLNQFPAEVVKELTKPIGPKGETRLMQIAAEESKVSPPILPKRNPERRPSKGMRKHIRNEKARMRHRG